MVVRKTAVTEGPADLDETSSRIDLEKVPPGLKLPKTLAACADLYYTTRAERLAADKAASEIAKRESYLREYIIAKLPASDAEGVSGKLVTVTIEKKTKYIVTDWNTFYAYIKKTGAFDLLQKRLSDSAVAARADTQRPVPGTGTFTTKVLSVHKRKSARS